MDTRESPSCPSPIELAAYCSGTLDPDSFQAIAQHVPTCHQCDQLLKAFNTPSGHSVTVSRKTERPSTVQSDQYPQEHLETNSMPRILAIPKAVKVDSLPEKIGKYFVVDLLGKGGFAKVYLAKDPDNERRQVAIKVPRLEGIDVESAIEQFLKEARTAGALKHPNIVQVCDWGRDDQVGCYVVMQYVSGQTLADIFKSERLDPLRLCDILIDVAEALEYVHSKGRVHRDVKPANILVEQRAWLSDFGLAFAEKERWVHTQERAGTPAYMAPEQIRGEAHLYRGLGDVWSLGVVLYEGLTGQRPFSGENNTQLFDDIVKGIPRPPREINPKIPQGLEQLCLKCLEKQPQNRYEIGAMLKALRRWRRQQTLRKWLFAAVPAAVLFLAASVFIVPLFILPALVPVRKWDPLAPKQDDAKQIAAARVIPARGVKPAAVFSSEIANSNMFQVDEISNSLRLVSDKQYLVKLGRVDQADTKLRVTIKSISKGGEAGIFIGLRDRETDGLRQFHRMWLQLQPSGLVRPRRVASTFHPNAPGSQNSRGFPSNSFKTDSKESTLTIHLSQGRLKQAFWNGISVETAPPAIVDAETVDVTGVFGVFTEGGTAVFAHIHINDQRMILENTQLPQ